MSSDISQATAAEVEELANMMKEKAPCEDKKPRQSQADRVVELAEQVEFFHQDVDEGFANVKVADHVETWRVNSASFKRWLSREFYLHHKKAPSSQALKDALNVLAARAIHDGKQRSVHIRVAEHDGKLYLDLADANWRAVEITSAGWSIIEDVPVKFIRSRGILPIPAPVRDGSFDELRPFLNVPDESAFALVKGFLISTLRPNLPFAFLVLNGEHGSAKTSTMSALKNIVDPGKGCKRSFPREIRDLAIAARNGWLLDFDNVSHIPDWMSDALCRLSTGGGFSTRELRTDSDEIIFDYQRPVMLTGIGDFVTRPDLLDRCIVVQLPVMPDKKRLQEADLNCQFEIARPRILGAVLDAVVAALRNHSAVRFDSLPRMADFAAWVVAAETAHNKEPIFLNAYCGNRADLNETAIHTSTVGTALLQFLEDKDRWDGFLADLLDGLNLKAPESVRKSRTWPTIPRMLKEQPYSALLQISGRWELKSRSISAQIRECL